MYHFIATRFLSNGQRLNSSIPHLGAEFSIFAQVEFLTPWRAHASLLWGSVPEWRATSLECRCNEQFSGEAVFGGKGADGKGRIKGSQQHQEPDKMEELLLACTSLMQVLSVNSDDETAAKINKFAEQAKKHVTDRLRAILEKWALRDFLLPRIGSRSIDLSIQDHQSAYLREIYEMTRSTVPCNQCNA